MSKVGKALATGYIVGFAGGAACVTTAVTLFARAVLYVGVRSDVLKVDRLTTVAEAVEVLED